MFGDDDFISVSFLYNQGIETAAVGTFVSSTARMGIKRLRIN